jgi:predicted  nucleic acid-binding Zn-ribbon protein
MTLVDHSLRGTAARSNALSCVGAAVLTLGAGLLAPGALHAQRNSAIPQDPSRLLVVDCLLPGQVRKLGGQMTYLSPRRAVKTHASDCEIRGGEYVAYDRANYDTALAVWLPQAEGGDAQAQTYVGEIYEKGLGRAPDFTQAAQWYEKAAAQKFTRAQMNLAFLYEQGLGVAKDPLKALNLYREASGIKDDSLTYVSEVTAVRTELQRTVDDLTAQLETQNTEVEKLKAQLDSSQDELARQGQALDRARGEARSLRQQVTELKSQPTDPARVAQLQQLEQELQTRESRVSAQERSVASLEADAAAKRASLAEQLRTAADKDDALRAQLVEKTQQNTALQQQLAQTQRRLIDTEQQAARLRADLTSERARIASDRAALAQGSGGTADPRMQAELAAREKKLAEQQTQIEGLLARQREYTAELSRLRAQAREAGVAKGEQQAAATSTRSELASTKRQLQETQQRVADLTAQLQAERTRLALEREQLDKRAATAAGAQQAEIERLRKVLVARQAELAKQQALIASLQTETQVYKKRIEDLQAMPVEQVAMRSAAAQPLGTGLAARSVPKQLRVGTYHALIIGNDKYDNLPNLETAVNDARAVDEVLRQRYGFNTRVLINATRADMLQALNDYRVSLKPDDNLLIYYAGHGELDRQNSEGYWLPVNAQRDNTVEWISGQQITAQINLMAARHVMVVADSCYQGIMTRSNGIGFPGVSGDAAQIKRLTNLSKLPSRTVLTSGGEKPVLDSGGGTHSIFAQVLLRVLGSNDRVLEGGGLYNALFDDVRKSAARLKQEQSPRYDVLADAGHRNGEFLFIPLS